MPQLLASLERPAIRKAGPNDTHACSVGSGKWRSGRNLGVSGFRKVTADARTSSGA
jgi:hypothetical protein